MSEEIVKGFKSLVSQFILNLAEKLRSNGSSILLCPAGDMTKAVINSKLLSETNIVGVLDQSPKPDRFELPEYHYNQLVNLNANQILIFHIAYGNILKENILKHMGESQSIEIINVSDYLTSEFSNYIKSDLLEYDGDKILICKPRGGFNDMLSQITSCWGYAIEHKRKLYVDTSNSGFLDCFSNYFESTGRLVFGLPSHIHNDTSVFPPILSGQVFDYKVILHGYESLHCMQKDEEYCYREKVSGEKVTFDFDHDYSEEVLVHEQSGRTPYSICTLANLKLKKIISNEIKKSIISLGDYSATHIRNTDYQTDYKDFLIGLVDQVQTNLLVCTDDYECKQFAKSIFSEKFVSVSNIPNTQGVPLHENKNINRYKTNVDAITDLLVLSSANKIYNKPLDGLNSKTFNGKELEPCIIESGFGLLAKALNKDREIIFELLN